MLRSNIIRVARRTMSSPVGFSNKVFINGEYVPASLSPLPVCIS